MTCLNIIHEEESFIVCIKPPRILSTDEPGGLPDLIRNYLKDPAACVRTVHRLDRVVSGLMVLARTPQAASELSRQIRENEFGKCYCAIIHGVPSNKKGRLEDLLMRNKEERKTYTVLQPAKNVQKAILDYEVMKTQDDSSYIKINLVTGRTHQIRCQFSSRKMPIYGDRKYSLLNDDCEIALWSQELSFNHPVTGDPVIFAADPPDEYPWKNFL